MPVFVYGASIGWMSPMTLLLQSDKSPKEPPLTDYEVSTYILWYFIKISTCFPLDVAYISAQMVANIFIANTDYAIMHAW